MQRKIIAGSIALAFVIGTMTSSISVYADDFSCQSPNNGTAFIEIFLDLCALQNEFRVLSSQVSDLAKHSEEVKLVHLDGLASCTNDPTKNFTPFGWCPNDNNYIFLIHDDAVQKNSVIVTTIVPPSGVDTSRASCTVESVAYIEDTNSGFLIICDSAPAKGTGLNYVIFDPAR